MTKNSLNLNYSSLVINNVLRLKVGKVFLKCNSGQKKFKKFLNST